MQESKDEQSLLQMTIQNRVVNRGIGRAIDSAGHGEDAVFEVIIDVLKNPRFVSFASIRIGIKRHGISGIFACRYRDNIRKMSSYQRLSENPLDKAVRLVEFVRQTGGAPHLKHHGRQELFGVDSSRILLDILFSGN